MTPDYFTPDGICSHCHGAGKVRYYHGDFDTCPTCHGTGKTGSIPVFVDRVQFDGNTYPDERIEVCLDKLESNRATARRFTGKISVPCAVPERKDPPKDAL